MALTRAPTDMNETMTSTNTLTVKNKTTDSISLSGTQLPTNSMSEIMTSTNAPTIKSESTDSI